MSLLKYSPTSWIDRVLHEFPWLWGIRQEWSSEMGVVVTSHEGLLNDLYFTAGYGTKAKFWVVAERGNKTALREVSIDPSVRIAEALAVAYESGWIITAIVMEGGVTSNLTLFRQGERDRKGVHEALEPYRR